MKEKREIRKSLFETKSDNLTLDDIKNKWGNCKLCDLCEERNKVVFPKGELGARVLVVGQWPGKDEDKSGIPFTGKLGTMCMELITGNGKKIPYQDVIWTNVLGCRIPEDSNFRVLYMQKCWGLLEEQIEVVKPKLIVAIGRVAIARLTGDTSAKTNEYAGKNGRYKGITTFFMSHPAKLGRMSDKRDIEAFKQVLDQEAQALYNLYREITCPKTKIEETLNVPDAEQRAVSRPIDKNNSELSGLSEETYASDWNIIPESSIPDMEDTDVPGIGKAFEDNEEA